MSSIETLVVNPGSPDVSVIARWRAKAFSVLENDSAEELRSLEQFVSDQRKQVALVAKMDGVSVGTCLLVKSEIDPLHQVSPWLAGLFVTPEHRGKGAGATLTRAVEAHARLRGFSRVYLYTVSAQGFYERLGWQAIEKTPWKGRNVTFMMREL